MSTVKGLVTTAAAILLLINIVPAHGQNPASSNRSTITAAATAERVRFTAPYTVVQMRLEVYGVNGQKVFDNEIRGGNVLDWHLQDGQAARLSSGAYLCVVTVKGLSGRLTQRIGEVIVEKATATLQAAVTSQLTPQQSEAVGPIDEDASLILLKEDEHQTTTVIAHNGEDGQITRGRGSLSFRIGDFFRGKETEQMRLTAEGNLGIGVANPQAKLDVAGAIRASQGIVFPDGSIQFSAARKTFGTASRGSSESQVHAQEEDPRPAIAGSGTTGQIPKWLDGPTGVLGDSIITELNGSIGINGAPNPIYKLDVNGHNRFRGSNVSFYLAGNKPGGNEWLFQTVDADGRLRIFENSTGGGERLSLTQSGNIGIGTATPVARLDIGVNLGHILLGNAECGGGWNGIGFGSSLSGCANYSLLGNGTDTIISRPSGGSLDFREANTSQMTMRPGGNVGIGTTAPQQKLHVDGDEILSTGPASGFKFRDRGSVSANDDWVWYSSSNIARLYRAAVGDVLTVQTNGNVGIGTASPGEKLTVTGSVQSTSGGFKFPDGSVQTSAANITYTRFFDSNAAPIGIVIGGTSVFCHLNVPAGTYQALATIEVVNSANEFAQNNARHVICSVAGGEDYSFDLPGLSHQTVSFHSVSNISLGGIDIRCRGNVIGSELQIKARRLTAAKVVGNLVVQ